MGSFRDDVDGAEFGEDEVAWDLAIDFFVFELAPSHGRTTSGTLPADSDSISAAAPSAMPSSTPLFCFLVEDLGIPALVGTVVPRSLVSVFSP